MVCVAVVAGAVVLGAGSPPGMRWIPAGEFTMGSADAGAPAVERPAHRVRLDGFWIDEREVSNAQFAAFVAATGYITTAERPVDWEELRRQLPPGTPRPPDEMLRPGSLVFVPPDPAAGPVPMERYDLWWRWTTGADWRHPEGPGSTIEGREEHPVVHVSWEDAAAYAAWAGKQLPTEAQWECAARGGLEGARFAWGDEAPCEDGPQRANIWQGEFPVRNTEADGWARTAPVGSYAPNGYGLHDMAGNVWEWCADWYRADAYAGRAAAAGGRTGDVRDGCCENPAGPTRGFDPADPYAPKRVVRGGSFLCHVSYCESYRPAARRGTPPDTGMSHLGFRCVMPGSARWPAPGAAEAAR